DRLAIDQRGRNVTIASSRAPQITFVADGREQTETNGQGRTVNVRASLTGDQLVISRTGDRNQDFTVTFDPVDRNRLVVTRQIYTDQLGQEVTVRSYYTRTSDVAQLELGNFPQYPNTSNVEGDFVVPNGTQLVAVLDTPLSTTTLREGDRFTMTVRNPGQYQGAVVEGRVTNVQRSGRVTGRSELALDFDSIRLRDGRTYRFAGILEGVRNVNGDTVAIDNEGAVRDSNQTNRTIQRGAIGAAIGAIIGAIAGGGQGAAIGAAVGAGAGAGSVYVQGRDDLRLDQGTEVTIRATGPR
ncbi:MAG TPA: YMGG-like glycine zipper-containing protein, partial [Pyrinomonadaceae bacterium]|nr:YMGG-like glycine zipper-containing protein [Pyrinomonadaceae bacterium]